MPSRASLPRLAAAVSAAALLASVGAAQIASADPAPAPLTVHTILKGADHGWTDPDDLTQLGDSLFVAFQNGVPSTGGTTGTPQQSTVVKFDRNGQVQQTWQVTGKCDGLGADEKSGKIIATVNEDGNSSIYTIDPNSAADPVHYTYDLNPLPHGGGTDSVVVYKGGIYLSASANTQNGPAVYRVEFRDGGIAHVTAAGIDDNSTATVANPGGGTVTLALTDPDSSEVVPHDAPRFGGDFLLDSQGDQQLIFADDLDKKGEQLQVLNIDQSVDDTAIAPDKKGMIVTTDSSANSVDIITGDFDKGTAYTAVTPGNANTPPVPTPNNYLGAIDLNTGHVTPVTTAGDPLQPKGMIFVK